MITKPIAFAKIIKKYIKNSPSNNSNNQGYYFNSYNNTSLIKMQKMQGIKVNKITKCIAVVKDFIAAARALDFYSINVDKTYQYHTIIFTLGNSKNFSNDGNFFDSYFNENSKKYPKILWIVINLDSNQPKKIAKNIILFNNKNKKLINLKNIIKLLIKKIFSAFDKERINNFSYIELLSIIIWRDIKNLINISKLKKIVHPYEGLPFQNYINFKFKTINKKIKTIGYVHATQPFPGHLFKRDGAPDELYVHGVDHKYYLSKFLGWNKNQIKLTPSLKIRKKNIKKYQNIIFLPFYITDIDAYLSNLKSLIDIEKENLSTRLKVKIHPLKVRNRQHLRFKKKIELLLKNNKLNKNLKYCNPIIIGPASVVLDILENGFGVYHIYNNPVIDSYSNFFWPNIEVRNIFKNKISFYRLKKKNTCINIDAQKKIAFF